jgi:hypothetical protein
MAIHNDTVKKFGICLLDSCMRRFIANGEITITRQVPLMPGETYPIVSLGSIRERITAKVVSVEQCEEGTAYTLQL